MQPDSGGYLEATPLTSFVVMSLASSPPLRGGSAATESRATVIREGVKFLANSIRPDGSWPIDTNLATWNTTLAINALAGAGEDVAELVGPQCLDWLLSCQHTQRHPFTGADPGGFGWSDLSGAVPDADDTPGAMLSAAAWARQSAAGWDDREAAANSYLSALYWLQYLQNRDSGWPTFCRGWGRLPFDRSGVDLTAHAIRAIHVNTKFNEAFGEGIVPPKVRSLSYHAARGIDRGFAFIRSRQHPDGSWSPLWFGNQDHPTEDNPVYGTAKVLMAYRDLGLMDSTEAIRGVAWLVANQNEDGGWGSGVWDKIRRTKLGAPSGVESGQGATGPGGMGHSVPGPEYSVRSTQYDRAMSAPSPQPLVPSPFPPNPKSKIQNLKSSVEETALAVEALLGAYPLNPEPRTLNPEPLAAATEKGLNWLIERVERGEHRQPAPIGFYFAKLWYYERLYPLTFTVAALGRALRTLARPTESGTDCQTQPAGSP
jgi:squalene-hopene/tetraprenyl-beta-curcumene cyclase